VTDITVEVVANPAVTVDVTPSGAPGMSAYQHAFANDPSVGTEVEWLASLQGADGDPGPAGTITVGTVTTGEPGTTVEVENVGTASAAVLNFTIPRGDPGEDAEGGGGGGSWGSITGTLTDQTDLQAALDGKSATGHTHAQADVTGLGAALAGKSDTGHTHTQSDVTGLSAALAGKADSTHSHAQADVTGLEPALAGKSDTGHTHATADVTGLDTALAGKASSSHTHAQSDVTGLTAALAGKSDTGHTHAAANVTDFDPAVVAVAFAAGSANNPHTTQGAARNASLPKNFWQYAGTVGVDDPTNAVDGDEWISA
jgi:hypothetical protein